MHVGRVIWRRCSIGKPVARRGRKATDLFFETAGLPALHLTVWRGANPLFRGFWLMKWSALRVSFLALALFVALVSWTTATVSAASATATAVLQPGRLTISNAPAIFSYTTSTTDTNRVLD